jgi:hypothetical protein
MLLLNLVPESCPHFCDFWWINHTKTAYYIMMFFPPSHKFFFFFSVRSCLEELFSKEYYSSKVLWAFLRATTVRCQFFFNEVRDAASNSAYYGYPKLWILRYPAHRYHAGIRTPTTLWLRVRRPNHSATTLHVSHLDGVFCLPLAYAPGTRNIGFTSHSKDESNRSKATPLDHATPPSHMT